jgi:hypothetical protein
MSTYDVFVRDWWKENPAWANGLEPCAGPKRYKLRGVTEEAAREYCKEYAATHPPGRLSRKAEYEKS